MLFHSRLCSLNGLQSIRWTCFGAIGRFLAICAMDFRAEMEILGRLYINCMFAMVLTVMMAHNERTWWIMVRLWIHLRHALLFNIYFEFSTLVFLIFWLVEQLLIYHLLCHYYGLWRKIQIHRLALDHQRLSFVAILRRDYGGSLFWFHWLLWRIVWTSAFWSFVWIVFDVLINISNIISHIYFSH